jgi:hypothetical protein
MSFDRGGGLYCDKPPTAGGRDLMQTVMSKDGSRIAYDRYGSGPAVILVGGALGYRKFKKMEEL